MRRIRSSLRPIPAALAAILAWASPAPAESLATAPAAAVLPVVEVGDGSIDADVRGDGGRLRFRNGADVPTRLVFSRGEAEGLDCRADGREAVRSRRGQFLLEAGAELACDVEPGSYRFWTLTQRGGDVKPERSRLRVR